MIHWHQKSAFRASLLLALLVGCSTPPVAPPADPDATLLDDHLVAARLRKDQQVEAMRVAREKGLAWNASKSEFDRVVWSGDARDLCFALEAKVSRRCVVVGKQAWVLPVTVIGRNLSLVDVLRDAGTQVGSRANFVDAADGSIRLEYLAPQ